MHHVIVNKYVRRSVNELTKKLLQFSIIVLELHSRGIEMPGSGMRCILCSMADTGIIEEVP